jgi:small subunit ribosomal protein S8
MTDPIADFLTRIRNGCMAGKEDVFAPFSKMKAEISRILQEEGYIWGYEVDTSETHPRLKVKLKYQGRVPVLKNIQRVSKPGLRKYVSVDEIPRVLHLQRSDDRIQGAQGQGGR